MKDDLLTSPKFQRLCRRLGLPAPYVAGCLEFLWHVAYKAADETIGDAIDVEVAAQWPGQPGVFVAALKVERFLDSQVNENGDEIFSIHNFWIHAPQYVERKRDRKKTKKEKVASQNGSASAFCLARTKSKEAFDYTKGSGEGDLTSIPNPTQPNPTQPIARSTANDVEDAFADRGIEIDSPPVADGPPPKRPEDLETAIRRKLASMDAEAYANGTHVAKLAAFAAKDGLDAVFDAMSLAWGASPPRMGAGMVAYVEKVLGTRAADRHLARNTGPPKPEAKRKTTDAELRELEKKLDQAGIK